MSESNETILVHLQYLREGMDRIVERLDQQNGRIGSAEKSIGILQDRTTEARDAARSTGAKWGAAVGTGAAAAMAALWNQFWK